MTGATDPRPPVIDAKLPPEMARQAEDVGVAKAKRDIVTIKALAILAGAFIAFGAVFMTVTVTGAQDMPYGVTRLLGGLVFTLGLILVVVGGAELFTGDNLMVMAWAAGRLRLSTMLRAWVIIFAGNLVGAVGTAVLVYLGGLHDAAGGAVGKTALDIAAAKCALPFGRALALGILCNVLVCLAVWMTFSARTVAGKVAVIVPPIAAFVAAGFEHSIANLYFLPQGIMIRELAPDAFWTKIGTSAAAYPGLTVEAALGNLAAVTLGNVIGGGVLVGLIYWFIYLRGEPRGKPEA